MCNEGSQSDVIIVRRSRRFQYLETPLMPELAQSLDLLSDQVIAFSPEPSIVI